MKTLGILFKPEMVTALMNIQPDVWPAQRIDDDKPGKWQTRRTIKPQPNIHPATKRIVEQNKGEPSDCPYPVGTILFVKEHHFAWGHWVKAGLTKKTKEQSWAFVRDNSKEVIFTRPALGEQCTKTSKGWNSRSPLFMEQRDARVWLEVKQVRVERVTDITEDDAIAEGTPWHPACDDQKIDPRICWVFSYGRLWDSINGLGDFERGDWVYVYDVARISKPK